MPLTIVTAYTDRKSGLITEQMIIMYPMELTKAKLSFITVSILIILNQFTIPIAHSEFPETLIVIDPGHGGIDPGTIVKDGQDIVTEKEINLEIATMVKKVAAECQSLYVTSTRRTDSYLQPSTRTTQANNIMANLYISIHANSYEDPDVHGISTYATINPSRNSMLLARNLQQRLSSVSPGTDRGIKQQSLFIRAANMPAVLVEVGFLTNPVERRHLQEPSYQRKLAETIIAGIRQYI